MNDANDPAATSDRGARRDTPLALKLKQRITDQGPITIAQFMDACMLDPEHGYYRQRTAIGAGGDFITAPEISQIFGELVGLWSVVVWQQMGAPKRLELVELGPGRGTMMADALRAARSVPAFMSAARVTLIETSTALAARQRETLRDTPDVVWAEALLDVGEPVPRIILGNEFLDALPVSQYEYHQASKNAPCEPAGAARWLERRVGLDATGALAFTTSAATPQLMTDTGPPPASGTVRETRAGVVDVLHAIARRAQRGPVAALFIDYGHLASMHGDTLQAVRRHRFEHPLTSPGEADLTTQVDFQAVGETAHCFGLAVDGPVTQAEFLGALGIVQRASRLMTVNPAEAAMIEAAVARLLSPQGMGGRFKVIGLRSPHLPPLPGFPVARADVGSTP